MSLDSLKQILLKKATDIPFFQDYIKSIQDEFFVSMVNESLKKMAIGNAGKGSRPNPMLSHFANTLTSKADVAIIRDALSHHLSHYKSALKNGQRDKADAHMSKIFPLIDLIHKTESNSNSKINIDTPSSRPWELNYTTSERLPNKKYKRGPEGWGVRAASKRQKNSERSIPDYRFMEMAPHLEHKDFNPAHDNKPYPWEEVRVGGMSDRASDNDYLYEKPVSPDESRFSPHPFDSHPIHENFTKPGGHHDEEHIKQYLNNLEKWHNSPEHEKALDMAIESVTRHNNTFPKPTSFYEGIPVLEQPSHAREYNNKIKGISEQPIEKPKTTSTQALPKVEDLPESVRHLFNRDIKTAEQPADIPSTTPEVPKTTSTKALPKVEDLPESLRNLFAKK